MSDLAETLDEALETGKITTAGAVLHPAMEVETEEEANELLEKIVAYYSMHNVDKRSEEELRDLARYNIGYWTGYFSNETAQRVFKLFKTMHPLFGNAQPTPEEAFKMGESLGT